MDDASEKTLGETTPEGPSGDAGTSGSYPAGTINPQPAGPAPFPPPPGGGIPKKSKTLKILVITCCSCLVVGFLLFVVLGFVFYRMAIARINTELDENREKVISAFDEYGDEEHPELPAKNRENIKAAIDRVFEHLKSYGLIALGKEVDAVKIKIGDAFEDEELSEEQISRILDYAHDLQSRAGAELSAQDQEIFDSFVESYAPEFVQSAREKYQRKSTWE